MADRPGTSHVVSENRKDRGSPSPDPLADVKRRGTSTNHRSTPSVNTKDTAGSEVDGQKLRGFAVGADSVAGEKLVDVSAAKNRKLDVGEFPDGPKVNLPGSGRSTTED